MEPQVILYSFYFLNFYTNTLCPKACATYGFPSHHAQVNEGMGLHLLFGHGPSRVMETACFDANVQ